MNGVHYRHVRNKVSAHTAFAKPEREDDLAMELTSLLVYTGGDFRIDKNGLILGESQIQMSGSVAAHVFGVATTLPPISFLHGLLDGARRAPARVVPDVRGIVGRPCQPCRARSYSRHGPT